MSKRKGGWEKSKDAEEKGKWESTVIEATPKVHNFCKPLAKSVESVRGFHPSTSNDTCRHADFKSKVLATWAMMVMMIMY